MNGTEHLGSPPAPWAPVPPSTGEEEPVSVGRGALLFGVMSWFLCWPVTPVVALVMASRAARRIRGSGGTLEGAGRVKAARILAISSLVFVLIAAPIVLAMRADEQSEQAGISDEAYSRAQAILGAHASRQAWTELGTKRAGTCFDNLEIPTVVTCRRPHDAEFLTSRRTALQGPYPGLEALKERVEPSCGAVILDRLPTASQRARYDVYYSLPTEESWADGDRQLACSLVAKVEGEKLPARRPAS
jgi:hypothetical protein